MALTEDVAIGLGLPHFGPFASPALVTEFAQEAEKLGLASVWVIERMLRPLGDIDYQLGLGTVQMPETYGTALSPLETLSYLAARTDRIRLGTSVIDALFHTPALLGRRLATVDHYSNGRLAVGLGQGYAPDEFTAANVPLSRRGRGFDEFLHALRAVWGPDPVEYKGEFYRVPRSEIGPKPLQDGGPPVSLGAASVAASERAGRLGIGLHPMLVTWPGLEEQIRGFRAAAAGAGHAPETLPVIVRVMAQDVAGPVALKGGPPVSSDPDERAPFYGTQAQKQADIERLAALGVNEIIVDYTTAGIDPRRQLELIRELAELSGRGAGREH